MQRTTDDEGPPPNKRCPDQHSNPFFSKTRARMETLHCIFSTRFITKNRPYSPFSLRTTYSELHSRANLRQGRIHFNRDYLFSPAIRYCLLIIIPLGRYRLHTNGHYYQHRSGRNYGTREYSRETCDIIDQLNRTRKLFLSCSL